MEKLPLPGLRFQIAAALAVVLVIFIVLTEMSVSKLTRMVMMRHAAPSETLAGNVDEPTTEMARDLTRLRRPVLFYLVVGAVLALMLASFAVNRLVVRPLHRLTEALEKVAEGKLDTTIPISGARETAEIGRAFNRMTTELKTQQTELEKRMARIEQSAEALKAAQDTLIRSAKLASVGTLAAGVAHEIGNPLTGLLGLTESLEAGVDKSDETRFLALMKSEILRIDRIIRELLSYARESTDNPDAPPCASFFEVLSGVQSLLSAQSVFDRIEWTVPTKTAPDTLAISPDDLTQVILNLLLNAAEAMQGTGRITFALESLPAWRESPLAAAVPAIKISISNTGPCIPQAVADRIFDPFYTTDKTGCGTGLGLSVCQNLCKRCGGDLSLDRNCAVGARFIITLPCCMA